MEWSSTPANNTVSGISPYPDFHAVDKYIPYGHNIAATSPVYSFFGNERFTPIQDDHGRVSEAVYNLPGTPPHEVNVGCNNLQLKHVSMSSCDVYSAEILPTARHCGRELAVTAGCTGMRSSSASSDSPQEGDSKPAMTIPGTSTIELKTHTGKGRSNPYKCPVKDCRKSFGRKAERARHMSKHFCSSNLRCPYQSCGRHRDNAGFSRKDKLVDHLMQAHKLSREDAKSKCPSQGERWKERLNMCFMKDCRLELQYFNFEAEIARHLRNEHNFTKEEARCCVDIPLASDHVTRSSSERERYFLYQLRNLGEDEDDY